METLIAIAIMAVLCIGIYLSTSLLYNMNALSTNRLTAVKQVEQAIHAITKDVMQAQATGTNGIKVNASGFFIDLYLTGTGTPGTHIQYQIDTSDPKNTKLNRKVDGGTPVLVATNIDTSSTTCYLVGSVLTLNITSTVTRMRTASETRQVAIVVRPT